MCMCVNRGFVGEKEEPALPLSSCGYGGVPPEACSPRSCCSHHVAPWSVDSVRVEGDASFLLFLRPFRAPQSRASEGDAGRC